MLLIYTSRIIADIELFAGDILLFSVAGDIDDSESKLTIDWKMENELLREKCSYSELFWSAFSRIRTEYGEIFRISPYSVWMRENTDQNNSERGHFLRNEF